MPFVDHDGLRFYYETAGPPTAPPLLIISGLGDYTAKCAWQMPALAEEFFVMTFDNRGAGRSAAPAGRYPLRAMADDAAAILSAVGIASAHVFGFSMGGMIALNLALRHSARVRRLVLGCTTAGGRLFAHPSQQVLAALTMPPASGDRRRDFYDGLWTSLGDRCRAENIAVVEQLAEMAIANPQSPQAYAGQLEAIATHNVAGRLGEIRAPTLVLHGTADRLIPPENGRLLADHIPGARLILYPDAGHLFFIEEADAVNRDIRQFLGEDSDTPQ